MVKLVFRNFNRKFHYTINDVALDRLAAIPLEQLVNSLEYLPWLDIGLPILNQLSKLSNAPEIDSSESILVQIFF